MNTKDKLIKLDANENPLGCSEKVLEHIQNIKPNLYPDLYCPKLRNAIAQAYNVQSNQIFCGGAGSDNLIKVITQSLVQPGEEVIIPEIAFPTYIIASNIVGAKSILVPLKDHAIDLQGMIDAITEKTKIIWLSNPHNPTGTIFKRQEFEAVIDRIPSNVIFVMDEAYLELVEDKDCANSLDYMNKYKNMVILRTFSKAYGLASMRIGYGIAQENLVQLFNKIIGCYDINSYAQECGVLAIRDTAFIERVLKLYKEERDCMYKEFRSLNIPFIKSQTSFIMFYLGNNYLHVTDELKNRGILVKSGNFMGMENWIRVSIGKPEENKIFMDSLKQILINLSFNI